MAMASTSTALGRVVVVSRLVYSRGPPAMRRRERGEYVRECSGSD